MEESFTFIMMMMMMMVMLLLLLNSVHCSFLGITSSDWGCKVA
jgi:hypothetical protein